MKLISFILSIIILLCTLSICSDSLDNTTNNTGNFVVQNNPSHPSHSDSDNCSPFCICNCCQSPVLIIKSALVNIITQISINYKFKDIQKVYPANFIFGIWNPPKKS